MSIKTISQLLLFWTDAELKFRKIKKELKKILTKSDRAIMYSYWLHEHAYIGLRLAEALDAKCISRCHRYDLYEYRSETGYLPFRDYLMSNLDAIFPVSDDGEKYIKSHYVLKDKALIKRSYLGTKDYGINPDSNSDDVYIVSCSNMVAVKRIDLLIKALGCISNLRIKWRHFGDGPLRSDLQKLAKEELPDNIEWEFKGEITNSDLMNEYGKNHYDIFINTSGSEGLPVSIMEAISFGIPVIATDVGGTSEIVIDGENGRLVDKCISPEQLAEIIVSQIISDRIDAHCRETSRALWENSFNADNNYSEFYSFIEQLWE